MNNSKLYKNKICSFDDTTVANAALGHLSKSVKDIYAELDDDYLIYLDGFTVNTMNTNSQ